MDPFAAELLVNAAKTGPDFIDEEIDAQAPNLPGPGRTLGNLYDKLGAGLERLADSYAVRHGRGSAAAVERATAVLESDCGEEEKQKACREAVDTLMKYSMCVSAYIPKQTSLTSLQAF